MARTDAEIDAMLDLACYCDAMSVMKTQWFGPNAGRRFRACWNDTCGYHEWIDEEPLGPRTLEIIKELQEKGLERDDKWRCRVNRYIEKHEADLEKVKKKQQATVAGMFMLVSLMMNMALNTVNTVNDDTLGVTEDYDDLDLE